MKKERFFAVTLLLFLLTGCKSNDTYTETATLPPLPTDATEASEMESIAATEETEQKLDGSLGLGFAEGTPEVIPYTGGEIRLPYELRATGSMACNGQGLLVFLDGRPQPYKTSEDDTYQYMHIFEGDGLIHFQGDLIFQPVTGQKGDLLEVHTVNIGDPNFRFKTDKYTGTIYTFGSVPSGIIVRFDAEPELLELPELTPGVSEIQLSQKEVAYADIFNWPEEDLETMIGTKFYLNGEPDNASGKLYNITKESEISMRFEAYGCPHVNFGLCLFVNNQPVSIDGEPFIPLTVERGMKTIVEGTLRVPKFDGEAPVYAMLVPRNQFTNDYRTADGNRTFAILHPTWTISLFDLADLDELYELKGYK